MSLSFSPHGVLVSDSDASSLYGECKFVGGEVESEIYETTFPGSNGVLELDAGDKRNFFVFRITWFTNDPDTVEALITTVRRSKLYGTITYSDGVGGTSTQTSVRLSSASPAGERISGFRDGDDIICMSKTLTFKKVRF